MKKSVIRNAGLPTSVDLTIRGGECEFETATKGFPVCLAAFPAVAQIPWGKTLPWQLVQ